MPHDNALPPEIEEMLKDPHALLKSMGITPPPGAMIQVGAARIPKNMMQVSPHGEIKPVPATPRVDDVQPPQDLLSGIETLLRHFYPEVQDKQILGMIYSPHKSATMEIAKVMESARVRDREEVLRHITDFIGKLK